MTKLIKGKKHIELGRKDGVNFRKEYFGLDFKYNDGGRKEAGYKGDSKFQVGNKITVEATIKNHIQDKTDFLMPLTVITRPKINKPKKEKA